MVSGCSQDEVVKEQPSPSEPLIFTASFEDKNSRTYLNEDEHLCWTANDLISIFAANTYNQKYEFQGKTGANSGDFEAVTSNSYQTGNDLSRHYAIYPYNSSSTITENGVITATLPAEQSYAVKSFGLGANTMVAATADKNDNFLKFKNVGGYLELNLYGNDVTIKSITLQGNSNEKIAGSATITPVYNGNPTVEMANNATNTITLDCGEGVKIGSTAETATAFWMVIPPTTFTSGFTITITDVNGNEFIKSTSKNITISRNVIKPMTAFKIENNSIIYYSGNPSTIEPYNKNGFNVSLLSNASGKMVFDGLLTTINASAFYNTGLISVSIPEGVSVKEIGYKAFNQCQYLSDVSLPSSLLSIGESAFYNCSFGRIEIPKNLTTIGNAAFVYCESLNYVGLPSSLTSIGDGAFQECGNLQKITIPENVTSLGSMVFYHCNKLVEIYCKAANPPTLNGPLLGSTPNTNLKIYVPTNSVEAYKSAEKWKDLGSYIEGYNF